jgi:UDP-N-acetylmuramate--alanine ligase
MISDADCGHLYSEFRLRFKGRDLGKFRINVPGFHNVLNATASVAVGLELDIDPDVIREGLKRHAGVDRRFQIKGQKQGITVVDDYGHHPTEIRATLAAARLCSFPRVLAIFQPHRYSRTRHLMDDFARSFNQADVVYLLDIYAASEKPIDGVTAQALAARMTAFGHRNVQYVGSIEEAVKAAAAEAREGDCVITLGAGNVWQAGEKILQQIGVPQHGS